ncbi:nuclear factor Y [Striga asiatica]|uniref:Nuclear factor Y n=1 Tax=Striga asiatica TaxID=4170 RepID=A0A5A7PS29_STRAF|nr:nuclear factor Y [Striga asiatica]
MSPSLFDQNPATLTPPAPPLRQHMATLEMLALQSLPSPRQSPLYKIVQVYLIPQPFSNAKNPLPFTYCRSRSFYFQSQVTLSFSRSCWVLFSVNRSRGLDKIVGSWDPKIEKKPKEKVINMIKRRFYRMEHGNRDDPSGSSSSDDDSEVGGDSTDETDIEEDDDYEVEEEKDEEGNAGSDDREKGQASSSSGYESEDSSGNEVNLDSSGLPTSDDDVAAQDSRKNGGVDNLLAMAEQSPNEALIDTPDCVLKCKSVFKCKLCPRIVCLSEETLKAHLNSKASKNISFRHARSEKLRKEGRLKLMLNDDGEIEAETHSDDHITTAVSGDGQESAKPKKKRKGPWKNWKRSGQETKLGKQRPSEDKRKKKGKNE